MSLLHDMELEDTIEAERMRRWPLSEREQRLDGKRREPRLKGHPASMECAERASTRSVPRPASRSESDAGMYDRLRAACCDESPLSAAELDEHAARVVLVILQARLRAERKAA